MKSPYNIWKNIGFVLEQSFRLSPSKVILGFVYQAVSQFKGYILTVLLVGLIVDSVESNADISQVIFLLCICMALVVIIQIFEIYYTRYFSPISDEKFQCKLNQLLDRKAAQIGAEAYEDSQFFDKMSLSLTQALPRIESVLQNTYTLVGRLLSGMAIGATIAVLDPICLLFVAITVVVYFIVKNRSNKLRYQLNKDNVKETRIKNYVNQSFMDRRTALEIRMTGIAQVLKDLYQRSVESIICNLNKYGGKICLLRTIQNGAVTFFSFFSSVIYLTIKVVFYQFPISNFVILVNANVQMSYKLMDIFSNLSSFVEDSLYIENLVDFLNYKTVVNEDCQGECPISFSKTIHFCDISYRYPNSNNMVLHNIDVTISKGEKVALVGRNGSGKSTLLYLLMRLYDPTTGTIYMDGTDIRKFTLKDYRDMFVVLFQDFKLYAFSVVDNMQMVNAVSLQENEISDALVLSGLYDKISDLPSRLDTQLTKEFDDNGLIFSGGEMQKFGIARAILKRGDIIVLDEPTSALDPVSEKYFFDTVFDQWANKTVIYISHSMATTKYADRIIFMEDGTVVASGTHQELMKKCPHYTDMYQKQENYYKGSELICAN